MHADDAHPAEAGARSDDARPLDDVRVIELCQWVAGPAAGGILADWGADVVKVEAPGGDPQRRIFDAVGVRGDLPNPTFAQDNRGKRSVVLDLGVPDDRATFERLLEGADVFLTNLRPAALDKLDLGPSAIAARHRRLVVASLSGYGLVGPARDVPGYDIGAFFARSGFARANSPNDQPPLMVRGGVGDHITGMATAMAVLAALHERHRTGRGKVVETSLFATGMYAVSWDLGVQLTFERISSMRSREATTTPLVNSYRAADGRWFYLIGLEVVRHFPGLVRAVGREDLLADERFATSAGIAGHAGELVALLDEIFASEPLDVWAARFDEHDVWWAPCQTMAEVAADPQAAALGVFVDVADGDRALRTVAAPARFDGRTLAPRRGVPQVGEHTGEVLAELEQDR